MVKGLRSRTCYFYIYVYSRYKLDGCVRVNHNCGRTWLLIPDERRGVVLRWNVGNTETDTCESITSFLGLCACCARMRVIMNSSPTIEKFVGCVTLFGSPDGWLCISTTAVCHDRSHCQTQRVMHFQPRCHGYSSGSIARNVQTTTSVARVCREDAAVGKVAALYKGDRNPLRAGYRVLW
jgi:hypothetical protein